jgi:hypothetical protein
MKKGKDAALEEIKQLHERSVVKSINVSAIKLKEKEQAIFA